MVMQKNVNEEMSENLNLLGNKSNSNNNRSSFFLKSINFFNNSNSNSKKKLDTNYSLKPLPFLSPLANSVVARCSVILSVPTEELQHRFDAELPDIIKQPSSYARNFLEFSSFQALHLVTRRSDYLSDKEFRQLTFEMMVAWEAPAVEIEPRDKEVDSCRNKEVEDEDGGSLFYSNSTKMAVQFDDKKTVGPEAFARIAPACAVVADVITVHNLFDALTSSSGHRLHFLMYDKYLRSLEKVMKAAKNAPGPQLISNLQLADGEVILDVEGMVPTQPVLQHIGISAWPGRLTLTNYALYFESLGVGLYEKAVRYDLAMDLKQLIKPELTGPLGARLFDKAVMYKSSFITEPVYLEFPEFKGNSRRDYWLNICLEIFYAHKFIRKYNLKGNQQSEALARANLGVLRCRAVREAFRICVSQHKTLLCFNLAESLPGGDTILETLSSLLVLLNANACRPAPAGTVNANWQFTFPISLWTLCNFGIISQKEAYMDVKPTDPLGDVCVGETSPLAIAVRELKIESGRAEAAKASVDQVKVEGIDTNLAVMKVLLWPLIEVFSRLQHMASWEDPFKSTVFLVFISFMILWGWIRYLLPLVFVTLSVVMLWRRRAYRGGRTLEPFKITAPQNKNAVEQLLTLQDAITQVEALIQSGNVILLKARALLFAVLPQATERAAVILIVMAVVMLCVPLRYIMWLIFLESFTRELPLRRDSSDKWVRRVREWWVRIPAAPVQLIRLDDKKKK